MAGIFGVFLKEERIDTFYKYMSKNPIVDEYQVKEGLVGRSTISKLKKDRLFETRNGITICFEGINLSDSIFKASEFFEAYNESGIAFINNLKGSFSGFLCNENQGKIFIFNDHLSTKNIFYYYESSVGFVFCSELNSLSKFLFDQKINTSINRDSVYMMALYGFLLEDNTYFNEIKKLSYSSCITFDFKQNKVNINKQFSYSSQKIILPYKESIDVINNLMESSIKKCWGKASESSTKHLSLLSGGMDARTNIVIAKDAGFNDITSITFGESNSKDIKYANKIAVGEKLNHFQRILDYPSYLIDDIINNYIKPNDGLIMFHSSAHTSSTVRSFNLEPYALLHTGQIGDALFGSFTKPNYDFKKNRGKIGYTGFIANESLLDKISILPEVLDKYQELGLELFTYEQRVINATLYGDRSLNNYIDNLSPFFDFELLNFCISLPNKYKKDQMIYFDWLKTYHKRALNYSWDKINMLPNNKLKIIYGKKFKKLSNGAKKYFNFKYESMNPYGRWLVKYPIIINTLDQIVNNEIDKPYIDQELRTDLLSIYNENVFEFRNKFAVTTALLALKLHFDN